MELFKRILIATLLLGSIPACTGTSPKDNDLAVNTVLEIEQSHIDGNVPDSKDFHAFLVRDLQKFFRSQMKRRVSVAYALLRDGPTQTGIAFPKFYAWVKIYDKRGNLIDQGAVRLAAEGKEMFVVTHFWNVKKIHNDEKNLPSTFPENLCPLIVFKSKSA